MALVDVSRKRFDPVGQCVYGGSKAALSREHIIPFSLGANWVLPQSSCDSCREITSQFEQQVTRNMLGKMRIQLGFPTRHKDERPTHLPFNVVGGNQRESRLVPIEDSPTIPIILPAFETPGILLNQQATKLIKYRLWIWTPANNHFQHTQIERILNAKASHISTRFELPSGAFCRMLAKIAHASCVAQFGIQSANWLLPEYIGTK